MDEPVVSILIPTRGATAGRPTTPRPRLEGVEVVCAPARGEAPDGDAAAAALALGRARGEFIAWADQTSTYHPDAMATVVSALAGAKEDVVIARARYVDARSAVVFEPQPPESFTCAELMRLRTRWFAGWSIARGSMFVRARVARELGGFGGGHDLSADYELLLALAARGASVAYLPCAAISVGPTDDRREDRNARMVRGLLRACWAQLDRTPGVLGEADAEVRRELGALTSKLALVERLVDRLRPGAWVKESWSAEAVADLRAQPWMDAVDGAVEELCAPTDMELQRVMSSMVGWLGRLNGSWVAVGGTNRAVASAARLARSAVGGRGESVVIERLSEVKRAEVIVTRHSLHMAREARATVGDLARRVKRGGLLVMAGEAVDAPALGAYLAGQRDRACQLLSHDTDMVMDPDADVGVRACVEAMGQEGAATGLFGSALLSAAMPGAMGLDPDLEHQPPGAEGRWERVFWRRYGAMFHHPASPWAGVQGIIDQSRAEAQGWVSAAWKRHE